MTSLKINSATLLTLFAPKGTVYSKERFHAYVYGAKNLLKLTEFAAVAEPCPKTPANWHMHIWCPFTVTTCKKKTLHKGLIDKLQALTGQTNTPNFTKPKKGNLFQNLYNDCRYAMGLSEKSKDKHHVLVSPGLQDIHDDLCTKTQGGKNIPTACTLKGTVVQSYLQDGLDFNAQYKIAATAGDYDLLANLASERGTLSEMLNVCREQKERELLEKQMREIVLWKGQKFMLKKIEETAPGRHIPIFIDTLGESGKSTLQDYLHFHKDHQEFTNAKTADIAYAYHGAKLVTFNFARSTDLNKVNYQAIENLLDGKIFSSKYQSGMKRFIKPKVALFCNNEPDFTAMSQDRWRIFRRDPDTKQWAPDTNDYSFTVSAE